MFAEDREYLRDYAKLAAGRGVPLWRHYADEQTGLTGHSDVRPDAEFGLAYVEPWVTGGTCLVIGCGQGAEIAALREFGCRDITALDVFRGHLDRVAAAYGVETICAHMEQTGLPDGAFDTVVVRQALHHAFYPLAALEELARICSRQIVILDEPHKSLLKKWLARPYSIAAEKHYEHQLDSDDLAVYAAFFGFETVMRRRFWNVGGRERISTFMNRAGFGRIGNRFCAVYRRL